jgi:hypothetical protein
MVGLALGATPMGWGPPAGAPEIRIPRRGFWSPVCKPPRRCHRGQQRGQDRRPQTWVITEHRDVLGEYQGFRDKSLPNNPPPEVPARPRIDRYLARAGSY